MTMPPWIIDVWFWSYPFTALFLFIFAGYALFKLLVHLKNKRCDDAMTAAGLFVAFVATSLTITSVPERLIDNEQATHRYNCIMYELALQRDANPDLTDVETIPAAWHELECYTAP